MKFKQFVFAPWLLSGANQEGSYFDSPSSRIIIAGRKRSSASIASACLTISGDVEFNLRKRFGEDLVCEKRIPGAIFDKQHVRVIHAGE